MPAPAGFNADFGNCSVPEMAGHCPPPPPPCSNCPVPPPSTIFEWQGKQFATFDPASWHVLGNGSLAFQLRVSPNACE